MMVNFQHEMASWQHWQVATLLGSGDRERSEAQSCANVQGQWANKAVGE